MQIGQNRLAGKEKGKGLQKSEKRKRKGERVPRKQKNHVKPD